jgi:putative membrane protein
MTETILKQEKDNKFYLRIITVISVLIPLVVTILFFGLSKKYTKIHGLDVSILPHLNAFLNSITFACLALGGIMIKQKNIKAHRILMMSAFVVSSIFLVSYVIYHNNAEHTKFGGEGIIKSIYLFILITHIILATLVVPFVLTAIYFAWTNQIERHKKIVKWTYPIWLYVASTGVIVYLMISPYYS